MNLRWTNAGRAALADAANVGTAALRLTHFAIGDMHGPGGAGNDGRAALRGERHRAAVTGTAAADDRIAFRADFTPDASYAITEAGVFGTVGDPAGPLTLYLYWTDGGTAAGQAADGTALAIASVIEFQAAAADVAVTVGGTIEFSQPPGEATESEFGLTRYADPGEAEDATEDERAVTPQRMHGAAGAVLAALVTGAVGDGTVYQLKGNAAGKLIVEERTQDGATSQAIQSANAAIMNNAMAITAVEGRVSAVEGDTRDATTSRKGIVELTTSAEAQDGTDQVRALTAKAARDSISHNLESLLAGDAVDGTKYALEGQADGRLVVTELPFEYYFEAAQSTHDRGTIIPIDGDSEWTIAAAGSYAITFACGAEDTAELRFQMQASGESSWSFLAGEFFAEGTMFGRGSNDVRGCTWCGDLGEGDKIRIRGSTRTESGAIPTLTISKKALMILRT